MRNATVNTNKTVSSLCLVLILYSCVSAAPSVRSPSAAVGNDATFGGSVTWTGPTKVVSSDDTRAVVAVAGADCGGPTGNSLTLRASDFGFTLNSKSVISTITVAVEGYGGHSDCGLQIDSNSWFLSLGKADTLIPSSQQTVGDSESGWCVGTGGVDTTCTYNGGKWGQSWSAADINDIGFSVGVNLSGNNSSLNIDHITTTVVFSTSRGLISETRTGKVLRGGL